jgi:hypothetical protein
MRCPAPHVVAVVAPAVVVGDQPGVGLGPELADRGEVTAVEGRAPALLEHGALKALADSVVIGGSGRDPLVAQTLGDQVGPEVSCFVLGPVVREDGPDPHPVAPVVAQDLVDEAHGVGGVDRAEHDGDDRPAGEDVDGGELVHLAHPLELADVEGIHADELARTPAGQAEPEGLLLPGRFGQEPRRGRRDGRRPPQALRPPAQPVGHQVPLHGRLGDGEARSRSRSAYWRQPMVGSTTAKVSRASMTWVGVASGIWGVRRALGIRAARP